MYQQPGIYVQQAPPPAQESSPYSFFLDSSKPGQKAGNYTPYNDGSNSATKHLLVAMLGLAGLLVGAVMVFTFLSSAPDSTDRLLEIANDQQELIRISDLGTNNVTSGNLQNFSYTAQMSLLSDQQALIAFLGKTGTKTEPKKLMDAKNPKVDEVLKAAQAANTYDATFSGIMQRSLVKYDTKLNTASGAATTKEEKELLTKQRNNTQLLMKQLSPAD